jgi:hypothetical protein
MREIVLDYQEFVSKLDRAKPVHHTAFLRQVDKYGVYFEVTFNVYGVAKEGHVIIFEQRVRFEGTPAKANSIFTQLTADYAKPLGSTEGRLES